MRVVRAYLLSYGRVLNVGEVLEDRKEHERVVVPNVGDKVAELLSQRHQNLVLIIERLCFPRAGW